MFHPLQVIRGLISSDEIVDHQGTPCAFQFIMSFICQKHLNATPTYISVLVENAYSVRQTDDLGEDIIA